MKKILITGANSYIGTSFEQYMDKNHPGTFAIDTLDMLNANWKETDFSKYDSIFHVAGIAHADVSHVSEETKQLYYHVNTDLAIETAQKAKEEGTKQFVFMSSMIVYGGMEHITRDTLPKPANFYGDSKWQADQAIAKMADQQFHTAIMRPPMIYGKGSKGNYPTLAKLAQKLPVFPKVNNRRSMLYIENLCEFLYIIMEEQKAGVFFPQNQELVNTSEMVSNIAKAHGKHIMQSRFLALGVEVGKHVPGKIGNLCHKAFGNSYYDLEMSDIGRRYQLVSLKESIERTEGA